MRKPISLNDVSIRDQIVPVPKGQSFEDVIGTVGADSIECAVGIDGSIASVGGNVMDKNFLARLGMAADGVRISALLLATDFSGEAAQSHLEWAASTTRAAAGIGISVLRIDPWTAVRDLPVQIVVENFIGRMSQLLEQTAGTGVDLAMENHGHIFNDPRVLDRVLTALPDERFGLTLDTGNLYWWGQPIEEVYRLVERYAPRAKHTHIKNINYPAELARRRREVGFEYKQYCCPLADGNLDLKRIVQILRQSGYARDFCVEDESLFKFDETQRLEVLKRDVDVLRQCLEP